MERNVSPVPPAQAYALVRRANAVVDALLEAHRARAVQAAVAQGSTLSEIATELRISKTTAHRLASLPVSLEAPADDWADPMAAVADALERMIWGGEQA